MIRMLRRDPGLFVLTCAIWALVNGASLLFAGTTFQLAAAYYQDIVRLGLREDWVGCAMLADGAALLLTVSWGSAGLRSLVAIASAPGWFFWGALMLISAAKAGLFTVVGAYDAVVALGLAACGAQWAHTLGAPTPPVLTPSGEAEPWT